MRFIFNILNVQINFNEPIPENYYSLRVIDFFYLISLLGIGIVLVYICCCLHLEGIQREEEKTKRMIKDSAKRGDRDSCTILAKEIVKADKQINKLYASIAHLNSVQMSMKHQLATLRVAGALAKSTEVMQSMQQLVKVPEIHATMREMSKEMMKAGIIEEMMDDAMETLDDEDLDEEADEEVDKVLFEITAGELGKAAAAVNDSVPVMEVEGATTGPSRVAATAVVNDSVPVMEVEGATTGPSRVAATAVVNDSLPVMEVEGATTGPSRVAATAVAIEEDDDLDDTKARL